MLGRIGALLLLPCIPLFQGLAAVLLLSGSGAIEHGLERFLEGYLDARVLIGHAVLEPFSGLRFDRVAFTPRGAERPLFSAASVLVDWGGFPLPPAGRPRAVTLIDPALNLEQDASGTFTLARLLRPGALDAFAPVARPAEKGPFILVVTRGVVRLTGDGPLPRKVRDFLAPGTDPVFTIPVFHGMDRGEGAFRFTFGGVLARPGLEEVQVQGSVGPKGAETLLLRVAGVDPSDPELRAAFAPEVRRWLDRLGVTGAAWIEAEWRGGEGGGASGRVRAGGVDLYPEKDLPLRFRSVEGSLLFHEGVLHLEEAFAQVLGGRVRASADLDPGRDPPVRFTVEGEGIEIGPALERALDRLGAGRDFRAFDPRGRTDFLYRGSAYLSPGKIRGECTLNLRGVSAAYVGYRNPLTGSKDTFPYRLEDIVGEVHIRPGEVEVTRIEGYTLPPGSSEAGKEASPGLVRIHGRVGTGPEHRHVSLQVQGRDLWIDEKLKRALGANDSKGRALLDLLHARGRLDVAVRIEHDRGDGRKPVVTVDLKDVSGRYEGFPYPFRNVRGRLLVRNGVVEFEDLTAHTGGATAAGAEDEGTATLSGRLERGRLRLLAVHGTNQPLTPELLSVLRTVLPADYRRLADLEYRGAVRYAFTLRNEAAGSTAAPVLVLDLEPDLDRVSGAPLPVVLQAVRGNLHLDLAQGRCVARGLSLRAAGGRWTFTRLEARREEEGVRLLAGGTAGHLDLSTDLADLLGKRTNQDWRSLAGKGWMDLERFDVDLALDGEGRPAELSSGVDIRFNGAAFPSPLDLSGIHGPLHLDLRLEETAGEAPGRALRLEGRTRELSLRLNGRLLNDLEARFTVGEGRLVFDEFSCAFYGGKISGGGTPALTVTLEPPYPFEGDLWAEDADLKHVISSKAYGFRNVSGRLTGGVHVAGELERFHRIRADGAVSVKKGALFELPIFGDLARLMGNVFSTEPPVFEGGKAKFRFDEGRVELEDMELKSSLVHLRGGGVLNPEGVDLTFVPSTSVMPNIPIVGHVVNWIKKGIFSFRVSGPYGNLSVSYRTLVDGVFGKDRVPEEPRYPGRIPYTFAARF